MAHQVQVHNGMLEMIVDFAGAPALASDPLIVALEGHARRLNEAFDLAEFTLSETAPGVFGYHLECKGGREVVGVMDFSGDPANPTLTGASTGPGWAISELVPFAAFRNAWMAVHTALGANRFSVVIF